MELLNLPLPKGKYLLDFLAEEEMKQKIQNSCIFIHDSIVDRLLSDGFKRKEGLHSCHILYRNNEKITEEIVIDHYFPFPFRNWSAIFAIQIIDNKTVQIENIYCANMITDEPEYLIRLKMEA